MDYNKYTTLVVSHDPTEADIRRNVLEGAGFKVVRASELRAIRRACEKQAISLVMIGYSLPPSEKRRVWDEIRQTCDGNVPVLELYNKGKQDLVGSHALFVHESHTPDDFIGAVESIPIRRNRVRHLDTVRSIALIRTQGG